MEEERGSWIAALMAIPPVEARPSGGVGKVRPSVTQIRLANYMMEKVFFDLLLFTGHVGAVAVREDVALVRSDLHSIVRVWKGWSAVGALP